MQKKNNREDHVSHTDPVKLTFEQRVAHLASGYSNSQSQVQFLDAKASAVIGAVPLILGILAGVFNWLQGCWQWEKTYDFAGLWGPICCVVVPLTLSCFLIFFAWSSLAAAFKAISPQNTGNAQPSVLFPFKATAIPQANTNQPKEDFESRILLFIGEPSQSDVIEDYHRQIVRMSEIVAIKLGHVKQAIHHLRNLFVTTVVAIVIMMLLASANVEMSCYKYIQNKKPSDAIAKNFAKTQPQSP